MFWHSHKYSKIKQNEELIKTIKSKWFTFSKKKLEVPSSLELRIFKMNSTALPCNQSILKMTKWNKEISWENFSSYLYINLLTKISGNKTK